MNEQQDHDKLLRDQCLEMIIDGDCGGTLAFLIEKNAFNLSFLKMGDSYESNKDLVDKIIKLVFSKKAKHCIRFLLSYDLIEQNVYSLDLYQMAVHMGEASI